MPRGTEKKRAEKNINVDFWRQREHAKKASRREERSYIVRRSK